MTIWARADVRAAFGQLLVRRDAELAAGERALGWKLGFGTPAALAGLDLDAPLVGYLLRRDLLASGSAVALSGWTKPRIEAEIALYLGEDLPAGATSDRCRAALTEMSLAFELIDVTLDSPTAPSLLEANVFQRAVVLGDRRPFTTPPPVSVRVNGVLAIDARDPADNVGDVVALTAHVADVLASSGAGLKAGDVIITGAVEPAAPVRPGERHVASAPGLGEIALDFGA